MKQHEEFQEIRRRDRLRYRFDNLMSRGTSSMAAILFLMTAVVVVLAGLCLALFDKRTVGGGVWVSLMHAIDAGTLTADDGSLLYMILMTLVTICGLFITSVLFGIVATAMREKMEALRKGKSKVLETGHTVVLGFNRNSYILLRELIEANANSRRGVVVVMDEHMEKEAMEAAIHLRFPNPRNTKIICRRGSISDLADLYICSPEYARSIIINSMEDFLTIKSILAVTTLLKRFGNTEAYLTAVIRDRENYEAARIAAEGRAELIYFEDTIARIVAQASRQPGLSTIYTDLFNYEGDEIYLEELPQLVGRRMKDLNLYFPKSTVLGIEHRGEVRMNPLGDTLVEPGDRLVLIAEDNGVSIPEPSPRPVDRTVICTCAGNSPEKPVRMLILGYGPRLDMVLQEEDQAMAAGSEILLAVQTEYRELALARLQPEYRHISVELQAGDLYHRQTLSRLLDWAPDSILVLNSLQEDARSDDNKTLLILLQLRALAREKKVMHPVTSEMRDVENQELAQVTEVRDFVISSNITSLMVSHISQCRPLNGIFTGLLTEEGSEIYLRPASDYVTLGKALTMYTACAAAAVKNQVFLGYRRTDTATGQMEIHVNVEKSTQEIFRETDRFIVLSEN